MYVVSVAFLRHILHSDGIGRERPGTVPVTILPCSLYTVISVKKLNSLKHLVRTTVAGSHN